MLSDRMLASVSAPVRDVLDRALSGRELSTDDALVLLDARGPDFHALCQAADLARFEDVGDEVSYVVCRNINFTNVCYVGCSFCGFARHKHEPDAYDRTLDEVVERAREARERGASEVCIQGGIHPQKDGFWYRKIIEAIKAELPDMHIHAFSPEEIHFGHQKSNGMSLRDYLAMLYEAGLGTIPGTAAEILCDDVRKILSPRKLMTDRWIEIVTTAPEVGLRSSSTLMYGHIERDHHIATHLEILRDIQKRTGGFTEFVPLGFIHHETRLYQDGDAGARPGPSAREDLRILALARLFLRPWVQNVQISWVKMGPRLGQIGLMSGANDFGGTLMEESISKAAGSEHGDHLEPEEIQRYILEIGRTPYERTTTYGRREGAEVAQRLEPRWSAAVAGQSAGQTGY
jgi:FO synthase